MVHLSSLAVDITISLPHVFAMPRQDQAKPSCSGQHGVRRSSFQEACDSGDCPLFAYERNTSASSNPPYLAPAHCDTGDPRGSILEVANRSTGAVLNRGSATAQMKRRIAMLRILVLLCFLFFCILSMSLWRRLPPPTAVTSPSTPLSQMTTDAGALTWKWLRSLKINTPSRIRICRPTIGSISSRSKRRLSSRAAMLK